MMTICADCCRRVLVSTLCPAAPRNVCQLDTSTMHQRCVQVSALLVLILAVMGELLALVWAYQCTAAATACQAPLLHALSSGVMRCRLQPKFATMPCKPHGRACLRCIQRLTSCYVLCRCEWGGWAGRQLDHQHADRPGECVRH